MIRNIVLLALLLALTATVSAAPAHAQATRTFVSGVGDDANPCSRTAPCKTFAGAIAKTVAFGEINCLDPGGFGALTITKSISIICGSAGESGVLVLGTNGIVISAAATDIIYLQGLDFEGLAPSTSPGLSGILVNSAQQVTIADCIIRGFSVAGVNMAPSSGGFHVNIIDSVIADNSATGVLAKPTGSGSLRVMIDHTRVMNNTGDGIMANGTATSGSIKMSIRDSESFHNTGSGYVAFSAGADDETMIDSSGASDNTTGIAANGSGAIIRFTRSSVTTNGTGVLQVAPGQALSYQTNSVDGNGTNGTFGTATQQ